MPDFHHPPKLKWEMSTPSRSQSAWFPGQKISLFRNFGPFLGPNELFRRFSQHTLCWTGPDFFGDTLLINLYLALGVWQLLWITSTLSKNQTNKQCIFERFSLPTSTQSSSTKFATHCEKPVKWVSMSTFRIQRLKIQRLWSGQKWFLRWFFLVKGWGWGFIMKNFFVIGIELRWSNVPFPRYHDLGKFTKWSLGFCMYARVFRKNTFSTKK